ncbi:hypothetical protein GCK32_014957 [Trichostrongylus colubriformis]|uniref:Uncharacterized protein n=1 Tax=Trichostrongylus colubriformis TaxID=6319 RepID=A0AAN8G046_TRICO
MYEEWMTQMTNNFCSPPKKRAKSEHPGTSKSEDYPDSDDSFNDPVLPEPSQITQTILQRRDAKCQNVATQQQPREDGFTRSVPVHSSPLRAPGDGRRKPMQRTVTSVTPRRFTTQERNDYHQNGQLLMLKNRVENMERERERLAAQTRDQLIAKEKHHAIEISQKEERIRQLEVQIQCLRQENLQSSFQIHNVTMSGTADVEMAGSSTTPGANAVLPTKRVSLPRSDVAWKNISRFGAAASVFANNSTIHGFSSENGSETFAHIPSQMLGVSREYRVEQDMPSAEYCTWTVVVL